MGSQRVSPLFRCDVRTSAEPWREAHGCPRGDLCCKAEARMCPGRSTPPLLRQLGVRQEEGGSCSARRRTRPDDSHQGTGAGHAVLHLRRRGCARPPVVYVDAPSRDFPALHMIEEVDADMLARLAFPEQMIVQELPKVPCTSPVMRVLQPMDVEQVLNVPALHIDDDDSTLKEFLELVAFQETPEV